MTTRSKRIRHHGDLAMYRTVYAGGETWYTVLRERTYGGNAARFRSLEEADREFDFRKEREE